MKTEKKLSKKSSQKMSRFSVQKLGSVLVLGISGDEQQRESLANRLYNYGVCRAEKHGIDFDTDYIFTSRIKLLNAFVAWEKNRLESRAFKKNIELPEKQLDNAAKALAMQKFDDLPERKLVDYQNRINP